jgi:hypothetical protein
MTIATTTFLKLNQSHFNQGIDYHQPSSAASDANDFYQHHHFPYHAFVSQYPYAPAHLHCPSPSQHCDHHYGTSSNSSGGKSFAHHTYQTIGPSTISSTLYHDKQQHHYAKPDNLGNFEIIETKKARTYDEMNNEI